MVQHFGLYERVHLLPVLDITLMYNTGRRLQLPVGCLGLAEVAVRRAWRWRVAAAILGLAAPPRRAGTQALLCCSLTLILGGALGNLIDRLRIGHVVDFILAHWGRTYYFPAFNVADSAITIGAALLLLDAWRESRGAKKVGV